MTDNITLTFLRWAQLTDGKEAIYYLEDIEGGKHRPDGRPPEVNQVITPAQIEKALSDAEKDLKNGKKGLSDARKVLYRAALAARPAKP